MPMKTSPHPGLSTPACPCGTIASSRSASPSRPVALGITHQALNNVVNSRSGISPEMAIRLDKAFGGGAEIWLGLQLDYDLARVRKNESRIQVRRVKRAA
jgi:antitoxin HigA-1